MTARLPIPGADDDTWGVILNDFLEVELNGDGTLKIRTDGTIPTGLSELQSISISSPSNNQVLTYSATDGAWENKAAGGSGGSPGGNNTDVQFNNSGSFGGSNNFQFDGNNLILSNGNVTIGGSGTNHISGVLYSAASTLDDGSGNMQVSGALSTALNSLDDGSGDMTVAGTLNVNGSNTTINGDLGVNGSSTLINGTLSTSLNTLDDGAGDMSIAGTLTLGAGGTYYVFPTTDGSSGQVLETDGSGSVTWQTPAGGGLTWNDVTGSSQTAVANNGYIADSSSAVNITLPSTAAVGDIVAVVGKGTGLFNILQNFGQTIYFGTASTETGGGGSIASNYQYDCVELVCVTANTDFVVRSSVGNLTVI